MKSNSKSCELLATLFGTLGGDALGESLVEISEVELERACGLQVGISEADFGKTI